MAPQTISNQFDLPALLALNRLRQVERASPRQNSDSRSGADRHGLTPPVEPAPLRPFDRRIEAINREDTIDLSATYDLTVTQANALTWSGRELPMPALNLGNSLGSPRLGDVTLSAVSITQIRLQVTYQIKVPIAAAPKLDVLA